MTKIHGGKPGEVSNEFFYIDEDGNKRDTELHMPILKAGDDPIDEKIMAPLRAKYAAKRKGKQEK